RRGVDPRFRALEPRACCLHGPLAGAELATFDLGRSRPRTDADFATAEPTVTDRYRGVVGDVYPEADAGELGLLDRRGGTFGDQHRRAAAHRCGEQHARVHGERRRVAGHPDASELVADWTRSELNVAGGDRDRARQLAALV